MKSILSDSVASFGSDLSGQTIHGNDLKEFDLTDDAFHVICQTIYKLSGIVLKPEKKTMVYSRLSRRLRDLNLPSFQSYLSYLQDHSQETPYFINALTTNLTKFFREPHHFEHLQQILEEIIQSKKGNDRLRFWSCASSSGEEPYSMAMTIAQFLKEKRLFMKDIKILATDIDTNMIDIASKGMYKKFLDEVPPIYHSYVHQHTSDTVQIAKEIQQMITFKMLNLLDSWPFSGPFDAIFCRNVVIYFDKETQRVLFERLAHVLPLGGYLYIGHSESLYNLSDRFQLIGQTIYQRIR